MANHWYVITQGVCQFVRHKIVFAKSQKLSLIRPIE